METASPLIIGGGLAGLSAGLHLAERGLKPHLLEADPQFIGGRIAGADKVELEHQGRTWSFRGEHGVHGFWKSYVNLKAMLARHALTPDFVPAMEENWLYKDARSVRITPAGSAIRHSWVAAPLHYLMLFLRPRFLNVLGLDDWSSLLRVWYSLIYAVGVDPLAGNQPLEGLYLSDLVGKWSPALRAFVVGLTRNGMAAPPEEVPLSGFIAFLRFYTLLRRDAWQFEYLPGDGGTFLTEPLKEKFVALGGRLTLGARITRLEPASEGWTVYWRHEDREKKLSAARIILATDAPAAKKVLTGSPALAALADGLYFPRGMASAVIRAWFSREPGKTAEAGMFSGDFILDNYFWLHRIQDDYRAWHKETGGSCIEAHIYGPQDLLEEPDATLIARAISDIQQVFPELRGTRLYTMIRRNDPTHTLFGLGSRESHLGTVTPWDGLYCAGDWIRHPAPAFFLERACMTGIEAANAVLHASGEKPFPLEPYPQPEPFAAFIQNIMRRGIERRKRRREKQPAKRL